jgi:hypothetical protein
MTSAFSYVAKSLFLMIFSSSIIAIFFRLLILALIVFLILPVFFVALVSLLVRVQLFLLSALLCEFLSSKVYNVIQSTNHYEVKDKKPYARLMTQNLSTILSNRKLSLFVHTQNVAIDKLIPKSMYKEVASENHNTVKIFDHHEKPIVSMEIDACRQALKSFIVYPELAQILKSIRRSKADSLTFVLSVQDLALCFFHKDLLVKIHGFAFELGAFLGRKIHVNLIIENMSKITGFETFLQMQNDLNLMHFEIITSKKNTRDVFEVFEESFTRFSDKINAAIRGINFIAPIDAQSVITFAQQLEYLKEPLQEVVASLVLISRDRRIFNQILINVNFLSSVGSCEEKSDILPKELQSCLTGN